MINDTEEINVVIQDNDSISINEGTPTDIAEIMHNEEIRIANETQRINNEEDREEYITELKQRVLNGEFDGEDGEDGFSPTAYVSKSDDTATISITDKNGTTTATISDGTDGRDGTDGEDGFSPVVTMEKQGKVTTLTITDATGIHTTEIKDGNDGSGTGDMIKATYDTNDNGVVDNAEKVNNHTVETDVPANAVFTDTTYTAGTGIEITNNVISSTQTSAEWGNIGGDIDDQTDLQNALDDKQDTITSTNKLSADLVDDTSTTNKFFSGNYNDLSNKPTIPTNTSDLNNDSNFISTSSTAGLIKNDGTIDTTSYSTFSGSYTDLTNKPIIPSKTSDLNNDSGFIDNTVNDLTNYTLSSSLSTVATSGSYADLSNKPTIPDELADLTDDSTHRVVTDTEKTTWNGKQNALVSGSNIKTINNTSLLGSGNIDVGADIPQQDTAPSNPEENDLWIDTDEPGATITVDSAVSTSSANPVENQAITNYVNTMNEYSTTEVNTHKKWIDGKPIYRKVINLGSWTSNSSGNNDIPIAQINYDKIIELNLYVKYGDTWYNKWDIFNNITIYNPTTLRFNISTSITFADSFVIIEYTKTTD